MNNSEDLKLVKDINENKKIIHQRLPIGKSFDIVGRELSIGQTDSYLVFIDGFAKDDVMLYILENLLPLSKEDIFENTIDVLLKQKIPYIEVGTFTSLKQMETAVLSGASVLILDGEDVGIIIDSRTYPVRSSSEPDLEKVTRGSRDGLVETIIFNTALIRRRLRDPNLIFNIKSVGKRSQTDVVIAYIKDLADEKLVKEIEDKIDNIDIESLIMAEKTLEECLIKKHWYNPLPQARFTERPDVVAAHLLEGHIAIIVDTSPSVMLLPVTMFHFTQHAEDYYQNVAVGTFVRWIRFLGMLTAFLIVPLWLLIVNNKQYMPEFLQFIGPKETGTLSLFLQFLVLEFGLELLRISSIHTPNALTTSLGIIGGLILSEMAITVGYFVPETVLYIAISGIGAFATPSLEFAMALRLFSIFLLILTGLFNIIGFLTGIIIIFIIIYTTQSFERGKRYTWPLIPFDSTALSNILLRKPIPEMKNKK